MLDSFIKGNMTALEDKIMALINPGGKGGLQQVSSDMDMGFMVICAAMVLFMQVREPLFATRIVLEAMEQHLQKKICISALLLFSHVSSHSHTHLLAAASIQIQAACGAFVFLYNLHIIKMTSCKSTTWVPMLKPSCDIF